MENRDKSEKIPPKPSKEEVIKYLNKWNALENYPLQEDALDKLFGKLCPKNDDISDILLKVAALNDFYSTNIFSVFSVAKHIADLKIDKRLNEEDLCLVNDIKLVKIGDTQKNFYSFASKYCSHHKPEVYPIYDSYVDHVLRYFRKRDHFHKFQNDDLKDYKKFNDVLAAFKTFYELDGFTIKQIDRYLWLLGKEFFPKKYE